MGIIDDLLRFFNLAPSAGSPVAGLLEETQWIDQPVIVDSVSGSNDAFTITSTQIDLFAALKAAYPARVAAIDGTFVRANPVDATKYQFLRRLRIVYPADAKDTSKVNGTGRLPLAVLVHGQHESWQGGVEVRNHDGYSYLQEALAAEGIVSVSVDTNCANYFGSLLEMRALIILGAIDALKAMDADSSNRLHDRIDLTRVALLGHSRGGDAVVRAAILNKPNKHAGIKCVISLAPTDFSGALAVAANRMSLDASTAGFYFVLYGGMDGDVSGVGGARSFAGTGFRLYDRAVQPKAMVYAPGCTHNRFNRTWSADEDGIRPADLVAIHSRGDHEALLTEYVVGLLMWRLLGNSKKRGLFDGSMTNSKGHAASLQWTHGNALLEVDGFEVAAASSVGPRTVVGADVQSIADVVFKGVTLEMHTSHQTGALAMQESLIGPAPPVVEITVDAAHRDWSRFDLLQFGLGVSFDVTSAASIAAGSGLPVFTVGLIDGAGTSRVVDSATFTTVSVPGKPTLHRAMVDFGMGPVDTNVTLHRLATVTVKLSKFAVGGPALNLADVRTLEIGPTYGFAQRTLLDSVWLVKS
ncbi:hypothetical protein ABZ477_17665 [Microbacterium sp. NPDC019599]|uniref:hypothetical protein n=1 Tax=Microbacterium sp. NPDC019599 TaxID=3154690 RepID=UPI0034047710